MRNKQYDTYSFRLDKEVVLKLAKIRKDNYISWNMLFKYLIEIFEQKK